MLPRPLSGAGLLPVLYCLVAVPALADSLSPVTVSASRLTEISELLPVGSLIIDRQMIDASRAKNTADLLDTLAGLDVRRSFGINGSRASIDLLGFGIAGNDNTLLLLNGRRINSPDAAPINLSSIPLIAIERIEVLPGSGSALYGYGASGGVINIITRERYQPGAGISFRGGDFDTRDTRLWAAGQHQRISALASAGDFRSDGYRDNNEVEQQHAFVDMRRAGTALDSYLTVLADDESLGLPGTRLVDEGNNIDQFRRDPRGTSTPDNNAKQDGFHVMPGVRYALTPAIDLHLDGGWRRRDNESFFANFAFFSDNRLRSRTLSPRLRGSAETGVLMHQWTVGWDWQEIDSDSEFRAAPNDPITSTSTATRRDRSVYLHDVISLNDFWTLTAGVRRTDVDTRAADSFGGSTRRDDTLEMYQGGVQYRPMPALALFFNAERSARLANFDEFAFSGGTPLAPQRGVLYSTGARWLTPQQQLVLTLWQGRFDDEIAFDAVNFVNFNRPDRVRRRGVSVNSRWTLTPTLTLIANLALQEAQFSEGTNDGNDLPLVPGYSAFAQLDWQALPWLTLSTVRRHIGPRRFDGDEQNAFRKLSSYQQTDLLAEAVYRNMTVAIGVYNVDNELAADFGFASAPGVYNADPLPTRHWLASIALEF